MGRVSPWVTAGGVGALVVADVALIVLAVLHVRVDPDLDRAPTPADGTASVDAQPSRTPSKTPTDDDSRRPAGDSRPEKPAPLDTGPVLLDNAVDGTVVRAARGECSDTTGSSSPDPVVEVSTDDGRSFGQVDLGSPLDAVLRVSVSAADDLVVIGAGQTCDLTVYQSSDAGETWTASAGTYGAWHLSAGGGRKVHAPVGPVTIGCRVASLSVITDSAARVLCAEGDLQGTANGGFEWVSLGALDGAVDIAYVTPVEAWAVAASGDCSAAVARTVDGGTEWEQTACIDEGGEGVEPQAVASAGGVVLVQAGGRVLSSDDGGRSFTEP
ncbi:MAG: hypothetical protein M3510_05970 [Actinomycetota bacterium]|nr:hypothetical protein [Actinomycetota bacterium]